MKLRVELCIWRAQDAMSSLYGPVHYALPARQVTPINGAFGSMILRSKKTITAAVGYQPEQVSQ